MRFVPVNEKSKMLKTNSFVPPSNKVMTRHGRKILALFFLLMAVFIVACGYCAMMIRAVVWVCILLYRLLEASAHC